LQFTIAVLNI